MAIPITYITCITVPGFCSHLTPVYPCGHCTWFLLTPDPSVSLWALYLVSVHTTPQCIPVGTVPGFCSHLTPVYPCGHCTWFLFTPHPSVSLWALYLVSIHTSPQCIPVGTVPGFCSHHTPVYPCGHCTWFLLTPDPSVSLWAHTLRAPLICLLTTASILTVISITHRPRAYKKG